MAQDDVDIRIPVAEQVSPLSFVVIISNENYKYEQPVPFAKNDGEIFKLYCEKALGIPEKNIRFVTDATYNDMQVQIQWLKDVTKAFKGIGRVIFYYSGHGMPDEHDKQAYLMPSDGNSKIPSTGMNMAQLYKDLSDIASESTIVFLDACFSGANRDGQMLASSRGVAIKPKQDAVGGNMVVFSAAQGNETAYPYQEKQHGLFTYYILKQIQEKKGRVSLGELSDYVSEQVGRMSILENNKSQTPSVAAATAVSDKWRNWYFVEKPAKRYESINRTNQLPVTPEKVKQGAIPIANQPVQGNSPVESLPSLDEVYTKLDFPKQYEIEGINTGVQGSYLVKVAVYTNKGQVSQEHFKYAAVHGILFKGISGKGFAVQKPLATVETEHKQASFFNKFWGNGDYLSFANIVNEHAGRTKLSKKEYKIEAVVSVQKDELRKALEKAGIVRGLNTVF
ncbi:MAG: caspase family protein [Prevotella sp.]|nr:caspase family protein [Prevotella sp.]